jgi:Tfp pilus assembly pilus retraction ATPase PilT
MSYSFADLMELLISERGEAVHLHPGEAPVPEINRVLHRIEGPPVAAEEPEALLRTVASEDDLCEFKTERMVCFYYHFGETAVFQVMAFREDQHTRLEVRRFR